MRFNFLVIALSCIWACQQKTNHDAGDNSTEITALSTIDLQKAFLEDIARIDQQVRHDESAALQQFGHNSQEHVEAVQHIIETDQINLQRIEKFLEVHGHPAIDTHGEEATSAPWLVIHHAPGGAEVRRRNFPHIYQAWLNGDLRGTELTFYLNRMYQMQFGERMQWDRPYREDEEIDTLIQALSLRAEVDRIELLVH